MLLFSSNYRVGLLVVLGLFLALALVYSVTVPIFEASDELGHYPMVHYMATHGLALPVQDPASVGPWKQEGGQPPLYYMLAALGTLGINTDDFAWVYQLNPHADAGVVPDDGNINMAMHHRETEAFPWTGTVLAVHVARFLSILMGVVTVLTTYLIGRELFPSWPGVALAAAALNAFTPMFLFISASVNNDNLSNMVAGLLVWRIVCLLNAREMPGLAVYVWLGILSGAALLAKLSLGLLVLFVALALLTVGLRLRSWKPLIIGGGISGGLTVVLAGWWYVRNLQLYGDVTGLNVFLDIIGRRTVPADLAQLLLEGESFTRTWWGVFGAVNVLMPDAVYTVFNVLAAAGILGFAGFWVYWFVKRTASVAQANSWGMLVITAWPLVALAALLRWSSVTWASQGRLLFIAIGPVSLWLAVGLTWWLRGRARSTLLSAVAAFFFFVVALVPLTIIRPAYMLPAQEPLPEPPASTDLVGQDFYEPGAEIPTLRLLGYRIDTDSATPGESVKFTLHWEVLRQPSRRWSLFVHAIDSAGLIAAQRDRYPGRGLLATERLEEGRRWRETVTVNIPDSAYVPDRLTLAVGLYDLATGERMLLEPDGASYFRLEPAISLESGPSERGFPNPRMDSFENLIALRGYAISSRRLAPGDALTVTLYWEALQAVGRDYTVFVHVIDLRSSTIYGGSDAQPAGWTRPTSTWAFGETVEDIHTFMLNEDTPPGVYQVEVGLYWMPQEGVFERLDVQAGPGRLANNVIYLSRVAVEVTGDE